MQCCGDDDTCLDIWGWALLLAECVARMVSKTAAVSSCCSSFHLVLLPCAMTCCCNRPGSGKASTSNISASKPGGGAVRWTVRGNVLRGMNEAALGCTVPQHCTVYHHCGSGWKTTIKVRRLRRFGHYHRMEDNWLPNQNGFGGTPL